MNVQLGFESNQCFIFFFGWLLNIFIDLWHFMQVRKPYKLFMWWDPRYRLYFLFESRDLSVCFYTSGLKLSECCIRSRLSISTRSDFAIILDFRFFIISHTLLGYSIKQSLIFVRVFSFFSFFKFIFEKYIYSTVEKIFSTILLDTLFTDKIFSSLS